MAAPRTGNMPNGKPLVRQGQRSSKRDYKTRQAKCWHHAAECLLDSMGWSSGWIMSAPSGISGRISTEKRPYGKLTSGSRSRNRSSHSKKPDQIQNDGHPEWSQGGYVGNWARHSPNLAVALNCGMGSSFLNALVNAFDKLHIVRGENSGYCGSR